MLSKRFNGFHLYAYSWYLFIVILSWRMTLNCNSRDTLKPVSNIQTSLDCCVFFIIIIITIAIIIIKHTWNENNHVSIQHINLYKFSEVTASIIKYTSILIVNCLQGLINNLLNLQTRYPIATDKSYQNFITDIVKLK